MKFFNTNDKKEMNREIVAKLLKCLVGHNEFIKGFYQDFKTLERNLQAPILMNAEQISNYLDFSLSKIYRLTSTKEIPHFKVGGRLYFNKERIDCWLADLEIY